jgi:hypothetical protein
MPKSVTHLNVVEAPPAANREATVYTHPEDTEEIIKIVQWKNPPEGCAEWILYVDVDKGYSVPINLNVMELMYIVYRELMENGQPS